MLLNAALALLPNRIASLSRHGVALGLKAGATGLISTAATRSAQARNRRRRVGAPRLGPRISSPCVLAQVDETAPFDPPDDVNDPLGLDEPAGQGEEEGAIDLAVEGRLLSAPIADHPGAQAVVLEDEPPPFDPPQEDDEAFGPPTLARAELAHIIAEAALAAQATKLERAVERMRAGPQPAEIPQSPSPPQGLPSLNIYAAWDRSEMGAVLARCVDDPRMARTSVAGERGGLERAIGRLTTEARQDIVIVDTTQSAPEILRAAPRLIAAAGAEAKVIVIGEVNDIAFLRELDGHGVNRR